MVSSITFGSYVKFRASRFPVGPWPHDMGPDTVFRVVVLVYEGEDHTGHISKRGAILIPQDMSYVQEDGHTCECCTAGRHVMWANRPGKYYPYVWDLDRLIKIRP